MQHRYLILWPTLDLWGLDAASHFHAAEGRFRGGHPEAALIVVGEGIDLRRLTGQSRYQGGAPCGVEFEEAAIGAYPEAPFDALLEAWLPLTYAVNSLNHSMGQPDLYPFVLSPTVMGKLRFVHGLIHGGGR